MLSIVILAGGLATRLRPITESIPKALVEVAGKPFISHQLAYLKKQGISKVVLSIGHLGNMIEDVVGDGSQYGLEVYYSCDGEVLLGTGGAIKKALPLLEDSFFILYGDSFLPIDFSKAEDVYFSSKKPGLMTVLENKNRWDRSNVIFKNGNLLEYNKKDQKADMHYIDYGLGILSKDVFDGYCTGTVFDLSDVYRNLSLNNKLQGLEVFERFYEIGSRSGIEEASAYLSAFK